MTVSDVSEMLGVTTEVIRKDIQRYGLVVTKCHAQTLDSLKKAGLVPFKTTVANLLPKATIQALVKYVDTDNAWAAYKQLWKDLEAPAKPAPTAMSHLADGVRLASKAASDAASLSLEVNNRVSLLATKQAELECILAGASLTSLQQTELQRAIYRTSARLGFKPGTIMGAIKRHFLPAKLASGRTWKEIPTSEYSAALKFVTEWNGNG
jgi:hypothetical protein